MSMNVDTSANIQTILTHVHTCVGGNIISGSSGKIVENWFECVSVREHVD